MREWGMERCVSRIACRGRNEGLFGVISTCCKFKFCYCDMKRTLVIIVTGGFQGFYLWIDAVLNCIGSCFSL